MRETERLERTTSQSVSRPTTARAANTIRRSVPASRTVRTPGIRLPLRRDLMTAASGCRPRAGAARTKATSPTFVPVAPGRNASPSVSKKGPVSLSRRARAGSRPRASARASVVPSANAPAATRRGRRRPSRRTGSRAANLRDLAGSRERELAVSPAAAVAPHRDGRLAAEDRHEAHGARRPPASKVSRARAREREPPARDARLAREELGHDARLEAEAQRFGRRALERRPHVREEDAPARPAHACGRGLVPVREVRAHGGRNEWRDPVALEDGARFGRPRRQAERRTRRDEVPAVVAEIGKDERHDVGGARGRGETPSLDARQRGAHDVHVGDRSARRQEERRRLHLVLERDPRRRRAQEARAAAREEDDEKLVLAERVGEREGRLPRREASRVRKRMSGRDRARRGRQAPEGSALGATTSISSMRVPSVACAAAAIGTAALPTASTTTREGAKTNSRRARDDTERTKTPVPRRPSASETRAAGSTAATAAR